MRGVSTIWIANDARCARESKSEIVMAKAAFNNKKALFTRKFDLDLRKKLEKCYIWSITVYGAETWEVDQGFLKIFEMWCWRRIRDQLDRSCEK